MLLRVLMLAVAVMGADLPENILNIPDWGFQSYLDEDFAIECNHSTIIVKEYNDVEWELPDGTKLSSGNKKYTLRNKNNVAQMELVVKNVQESDAGVYVCHVYSKTTHVAPRVYRGPLLRGLNLGGHKYRKPFDEYRTDLLVGGLAAAALFVFLCSLCFIYKFRYQKPEQKQAKVAARHEATKHQRYLAENGAGKDAEMATSKGEDNSGYENAEETNTRL